MLFLYIYFGLIFFYLYYIAAVNIYYTWNQLKLWVQIVCAAPMFIFLLFDFTVNMVLTLPFWDIPREYLTTQRLSRYKADGYPAGLRKDIAVVICTQALNPFDPTKHHC